MNRWPFFILRPQPSEIWVGKDAGAGAQITVPSVRGDQVLWMCGGRVRQAGVADISSLAGQPATRGAVAPCQGQTTTTTPPPTPTPNSTPFSALKDLIRALDQLVFTALKPPRVGSRSDAMLAVYPGKGARFQRHVDNTANDGRVLTVICYLNPDWDPAHGGGLVVDAREGGTDRQAGGRGPGVCVRVRVCVLGGGGGEKGEVKIHTRTRTCEAATT